MGFIVRDCRLGHKGLKTQFPTIKHAVCLLKQFLISYSDIGRDHTHVFSYRHQHLVGLEEAVHSLNTRSEAKCSRSSEGPGKC